jgi:type II secretory pathway component PulM
MVELTQFMLSFGPIAFGVAVLVILWKMIVKPELDSRRIEQQALHAQVDNMRLLTGQIKETAGLHMANCEAMTALVEAQRALVRELTGLVREHRTG